MKYNKIKSREIDWRHPLAKGLVVLFYPRQGLLINLANKTIYDDGIAVHQIGHYGEELYNNIQPGYALTHTLRGEFSAFTFVNYNGSAVDHAIANFYDGTDQKPIIWADVVSTQLRPGMFSGTTAIYGTSNSLTTGYHCWGAAIKGGDSTSALFRDGVIDGTGNPGTISSVSGTITVHDNFNHNKKSNGRHVWTAVWDRKLTNIEGQLLTANPFYINRLIKTKTQVIAKPPAIGGTTIPILAYHHNHNIGSHL